MFSLIRSVIIIGLIFYFSPARELREAQHHTPEEERALPSPQGRLASAASNLEDGLWGRIAGNLGRDAVRSAVNDRVQAAGPSLRDDTPWSQSSLSARPASATPSRPFDRAAAEQDNKSRRCIYRCGAAE